jgi:hypothetical protein
MTRILAYALTVAVYVALAGVNLWLIANRLSGRLTDKVAGLLLLIGAYALVLGLLSALGIFKEFAWLQADLTSPDPGRFLMGNLLAVAIMFKAMFIALDPATASSGLVFLLRIPLLLALALVLFAYALVHLLVVVPVTYFAYLVTSQPIDAVLAAPSEVEFRAGRRAIRIKALVEENAPALRNFAVALPAFALSVILKILPLLQLRPQ